MDMICACDIRLAAKDAIFSIRETRMGIVADLGTLQRLPHIIGQGWLRELALTGRDFTAEEALQMELITRICDDRSITVATTASMPGCNMLPRKIQRPCPPKIFLKRWQPLWKKEHRCLKANNLKRISNIEQGIMNVEG
jgi:enoyl-CoA hydratase/carnithine racemase